MADVQVVTYSTSLPTSDDTTWDVDPSALTGVTPKAVLVTLSRASDTSDTATDGAMFSFGAATGTSNQWCASVVMEHNTATTDTNRMISNSYCARCFTTATGTGTTVAFVSFHSGGVRLNVDVISDGGGFYANFVFFCGDDLDALADMDTQSSTQQTYGSASFTPEMMIAGAIGHSSLDFLASSAQFMIGVATDNGTSIDEFHTAQFSSSGAGSSTNGQDIRNDGFTGQINTYVTTCDEFNSSGFKHTCSTSDGNGEYFGFLLLGFGTSGVAVWSDVVALPTSTGNTSFTNAGGDGPNFKPQWVGLLPSLCTTINTSEETVSLSNGFGNFDAAREYCISISDEDSAASATDTQSLAEDKALKLPKGDGTESTSTSYVATAATTRFENTGFALNFTSVNTTTAQLAVAFAIEEVGAVFPASGSAPSKQASAAGAATWMSGPATTWSASGSAPSKQAVGYGTAQLSRVNVAQVGFTIVNMIPIGDQLKAGLGGQTRSGVPNRWMYKTADSRTAVATNGYFNSIHDSLEVGDVIDVLVFDNIDTESELLSAAGSYIVKKKDNGTVILEDSLNYSDLRADVNVIQSAIDISPPITGITGFNAVIGTNTTIVTIAPLTHISYTHWLLTYNDTSLPIWPDDYTAGTLPTNVDIDTWDSTDIQLWIGDSNSNTFVSVYTAQGEQIITIEPNDTLGPVWAAYAFSLSAGTDPLTQIELSITDPVDAGSGLLRLDLHNAVNDNLLRSDVSDTDVVSNLVPGTTYIWYVKAYDNAGNTSNSNSITLATSGTSSAGTVSFTSAAFEANQSTGTMAITLTRTGGTTGAIAVTVSTIDRTAIDGVNYDSITSTQVDFANGASTQTAPLAITLDTSPVLDTNDMFEIQIDHGSEDTGAVTCTIGSINAALCKIISSGSGVAGFQQESSGDYKAVIETESSYVTLVNSIATDGSKAITDAFVVGGPGARMSPYPSGYQILPNNTQFYGTQAVMDGRGPHAIFPINFTQTGDHTIHARMKRNTSTLETVHFALERELVSIGADGTGASAGGNSQLITLAADHGMVVGDEVFFEDITGTAVAAYECDATNSTSFAITGVPNTDEIEIADTGDAVGVADASGAVCYGEARMIDMYAAAITEAPTQAAAGYRWVSENEANTAREFYIGEAGSYNLRMYQQDYQAQVDKVIVSLSSASYDPSLDGIEGDSALYDDYFGPDESNYSAGSIEDNPNNPTSPSQPLPGTEIFETSLFPTNGDTNIPGVGLVIQAEFALTEIVITTFTVEANGTEVSGVYYTDAGRVIFESTGTYPNAASVVVTLLGTGRDATTNELKYFSLSGTDWVFTIIDTGDSGTLFTQNFSTHLGTTSPYKYTETLIQADFNTDSRYGDNFIVGPDKDRTYIVDDPAPNPTRGKVLRVTAPGGFVNIGSCINVACDFGSGNAYDDTGPQDIYFAYDVFLAEDFVFTRTQKFPGLFTGTRLEASHGPDDPVPEGDLAFSLTPSLYTQDAYNIIPWDAVFSTYIYDELIVQRDDWWDTVDDDVNLWPNRDLVNNNPYQPTRGRWLTIEQRIKMNTAGTPDGIIEVWVVDPARWVGSKKVLSDTARQFKGTGNQMSADRFWLSVYYGGNPSDPLNQLAVTQYHYFDNFIVSTNPIIGVISAFDRVPVISGQMDYSWFEAAKNLYTAPDDPIDWPALYAASTDQISVPTDMSFTAALAAAAPGDIIMLEDGVHTNDGEVLDAGNSSSDPIVITAKHKALGIAGGVTFADTGWRLLKILDSSRNIIIGGFSCEDYTHHAIWLEGSAGGAGVDGASDIRITDMHFENIGIDTGDTDGTIQVGTRCNNVRIDHSSFINNYSEIRFYGDGTDSHTDNTKDGRVDHNYIGPIPTSFGAASYGIGMFQCYDVPGRVPADDDMTVTFDYNICEMPNSTNVDSERLAIKVNGVVIENNIITSPGANGNIQLRQSHNSTVQNNYLVQCGITAHGANNLIHNNKIYQEDVHNYGIRVSRWGMRESPNCTRIPETHDSTITNNKIYDAVEYGIQMGDEDAGARRPIYDCAIQNNYMEMSQGTLGHNNTETLANRTTDTCGTETGNDLDGGTNSGITWTNNTYVATGTAVNGSGYDAET